MQEVMDWSLTNFSLVMLALSAVIMYAHHKACPSLSIYEIIYRWIALFPVGMNELYMTYLQFGAPGGMGNFIIAVLAITSFNAHTSYRRAATLAVTLWLWSDAFGVITAMLMTPDLSFVYLMPPWWMDIILPLVMMRCVAKIK